MSAASRFTRRRGPMVESRISYPLRWLALLVSIVCAIFGAGLVIAIGNQPDPAGISRLFAQALGGVVSLGGLAGVFTLMRNWSIPITHAADEVLADVPSHSAPIGPWVFRFVPVAIVDDARGWQLRRKTSVFRSQSVFQAALAGFVATVMLAVTWSANGPLAMQLGVTAAVVVVALLVARRIHSSTSKAYDATATLSFLPDPSGGGTLRFETDVLRELPLEAIVAVQFCRVRARTSEGWIDAYQVNLVRRGDAEVSPGEIYRRLSLVCCQAMDRELVELAESLADRLNVPLLCHATAVHWRAERQAAKTREAAVVELI